MHIFPNNKKYIGITKQKPEKRWKYGDGYRTQHLFYRAIKKYGWSNIEHKILFSKLSKEEAEQKEIELIKKFKTNNSNFGYNIDNGGNTIGTFSEEHRKKISKALKGKKKSKEAIEKARLKKIGKVAWNKGKKNIYKKKTLKKMSKNKIDLWKTKKYRDKLTKRILCIETGMIFNSHKEASIWLNGTNKSHIGECCNKKEKSCGKYNGIKLHWTYIKEERNNVN